MKGAPLNFCNSTHHEMHHIAPRRSAVQVQAVQRGKQARREAEARRRPAAAAPTSTEEVRRESARARAVTWALGRRRPGRTPLSRHHSTVLDSKSNAVTTPKGCAGTPQVQAGHAAHDAAALLEDARGRAFCVECFLGLDEEPAAWSRGGKSGVHSEMRCIPRKTVLHLVTPKEPRSVLMYSYPGTALASAYSSHDRNDI